MQEPIRESQPQALPYAAAVPDPALVDDPASGPLDEGIEQGLATAPATEVADVAYSHTDQPALSVTAEQGVASTPSATNEALTTHQQNSAANDTLQGGSQV